VRERVGLQPELLGATKDSARRRRQHARYRGLSKSVTATCVERFPNHLLRRIKGSCQLLLCVEACVEPINDLDLVLRTRKGGNCSVLHRDQGVVRVVGREVTAGTTDTAGWSVLQEFSRVFSSQSTDGSELFEMGVTPNEGQRELIQEEK